MNPPIIENTHTFGALTLRSAVLDGARWFVATDLCHLLRLSCVTYYMRKLPETAQRREKLSGRGPSVHLVTAAGARQLVQMADSDCAVLLKDLIKVERAAASRFTVNRVHQLEAQVGHHEKTIRELTKALTQNPATTPTPPAASSSWFNRLWSFRRAA